MAQVMPETKPVLSTEELPVFRLGDHTPTSKTVKAKPWLRPSNLPPKASLIFAPSEQGTYPVILFFHGFFLSNSYYTDLLKHIASHGFIVVAPQLPSIFGEISGAGQMAKWLKSGLQSQLPDSIKPDLGKKVALVGHSKGGKTAFALALGHGGDDLKQEICALVGIDPVAGTDRFPWFGETPPKILSNEQGSFTFTIPATVIGTGLGCNCAPKGLNHEVFFKDCKPPRAYFVPQDYGHLDVLNDGDYPKIFGFPLRLCKEGEGRDYMRRCVGGIVIAFLKYYLEGQQVEFETIVGYPDVSPATLDKNTIQFDRY